MDPETPYLLPDGQRVWVINTAEASKHLSGLLDLFRGGSSEPLIFGDNGQPEAVVVPWDVWRRLAELAEEEEGFEHIYDLARERLKDDRPSVPIEDLEAELGFSLDDEVDDSDLPKPR
jgi:hypothetical protein